MVQTNPDYEPIVLTKDDPNDVQVVAEFVTVLRCCAYRTSPRLSASGIGTSQPRCSSPVSHEV